jgi:hypothetical protein
LSREPVWSLYLFDSEDPRWRRPWDEMLPVPFREVAVRDGRFQHDEGVARDGIVLVHASRLPPAAQQRALFTAAAAVNLHIVLLSGGHQDTRMERETVHVRRAPLRPRDLDPVFKRCMRRFWDHLSRSGETCFALLEPDRDSSAVLALLCQGYLLAHVVPGTTRVGFDGGDEALQEEAAAALARMGLDPEMTPAASALEQEQRAHLTRSPDWWSILDVGELRRSLQDLPAEGTALHRLLDCIAAGQTVNPQDLVAAYLELESDPGGGPQ